MPSFLGGLMYPFEQKGWLKAMAIAVGMAAIPIVGYFMIRGWEYEISVRVRHDYPDLLPGWGKPAERFKRGLAIRLAGWTYNIPTIVLALITIWLWLGPIVDAIGGRIPLNTPIDEIYRPALPIRISMILITLIMYFVMQNLFWAGYMRYVDTRSFVLLFDLGTNFVVMITTMWDDFIIHIYTFFAEIVAGLLAGAVAGALAATGVGVFLIPILSPAVHLTFMSMVGAYWLGEMTQNTFGDDPVTAEQRLDLDARRTRRAARESRLRRLPRRNYRIDRFDRDSH